MARALTEVPFADLLLPELLLEGLRFVFDLAPPPAAAFAFKSASACSRPIVSGSSPFGKVALSLP